MIAAEQKPDAGRVDQPATRIGSSIGRARAGQRENMCLRCEFESCPIQCSNAARYCEINNTRDSRERPANDVAGASTV